MYKVMLIDDEESMQKSIRKLLEQNGYAFCGALDGETGLTMLAAEKPDLLLLDVMLPGINGFDLCQRERRFPQIGRAMDCGPNLRAGDISETRRLALR